jgi:hypothetical protein
LSDGAGDAARLANDLRDALGPDPRRPVREWLSAAFDDLQADVGPHPALEKMKAELVRLETRYA